MTINKQIRVLDEKIKQIKQTMTCTDKILQYLH